MNLNKELDLQSLQEDLCKYNFTIRNSNGIICITNKNGVTLGIGIAPVSLQMERKYNLDSSLSLCFGLPNVPREWTDADKIITYIKKKYLPMAQYLGGHSELTEIECESLIKNILENRKIDFTFEENKSIKVRIFFEKLKPYARFCEFFYKGFLIDYKGRKYFIKSTKYISFIELLENDEVGFEYFWNVFCPITKSGKEYVCTSINNFLDFISSI